MARGSPIRRITNICDVVGKIRQWAVRMLLHLKTSPINPQSNGLAGRVINTFRRTLMKITAGREKVSVNKSTTLFCSLIVPQHTKALQKRIPGWVTAEWTPSDICSLPYPSTSHIFDQFQRHLVHDVYHNRAFFMVRVLSIGRDRTWVYLLEPYSFVFAAVTSNTFVMLCCIAGVIYNP